MSESKLKISTGEHRIISCSEGYHWFPHTLFKLNDGRLLLGFSVCDDAVQHDLVKGLPHALVTSTDGGANWFLERCVRADSEPWPSSQLEDGTILAYGATYLTSSGEVFGRVWRSRDNAKTYEGPTQVPMSFPEGLIREPDYESPGWLSAGVGGPGQSVQLENGDLVAISEGRFRGDKKDRTFVLTSADKGASWSYLSTVACDPEMDFHEAYMIRVPDGRLLCMLRTGSFKPMYQCWSSDQGKTWSKPVKAGVIGVCPKLLLMSNGVVACSYGRSRSRDTSSEAGPLQWHFPSEDVWIMFSLDGGETWTNHTLIHQGPSTGYTSIIELSLGELLLTYDTLGFGWGKRDNFIRMVKIRVERSE